MSYLKNIQERLHKMKKLHDLVQSSTEWHDFRAKHFGASEASAMLGFSPYKTRTQLLDEKKTGLVQEVDSFTQKIFSKGHEVERLALPIVEKMIGEDLSPVTCSDGNLSASCDGLSFMSDIAWENKQFNKAHYEQVKNGELPEIHWPQCQQVLHVTGAEKLFFTISDGTEENTAGVWVYPDAEKIKQIINGWAQFAIDLENHVPTITIEKVEAEQVKTLPVPSVVVRGEIVESNLTRITPQFDAYLGSVNTELSTDQDFADAEANAKNCRETAKRIVALRENIIAQMVTVNEVNSVLSNYESAFNTLGLRLEKAVKEQKETLKTNAIMKARNEYSDFITALNKDCIVVLHQHLVAPDFGAAIKGVKTIDSMHSRINDALAKAKVEATTLANEIKAKIEFINEASKGYEHLINVAHIATADLDYIKLYLAQAKSQEDKRKADYEAAIKAQAEADARAKLEREAQEKAAAEAKQNNESASAPNMMQTGDGGSAPLNPAKVISEVAPVNHIVEANKMIETATQPTQYFFSTEPSVNEIVCAVAASFKVDEMQAHKWLISADFTKFEIKKAA